MSPFIRDVNISSLSQAHAGLEVKPVLECKRFFSGRMENTRCEVEGLVIRDQCIASHGE